METQQPRQEPDFDKSGGLVPAIAQDAHTGEVLMLAWMNQEAWRLTKESRVAVYWSRSRQSLWRKGMISGNIQKVKEVLLDCDLDTILLKVEQVGDAACHTGRRSCFHHRVTDEDLEITQEPLFNPKEVYGP